MVERRQAGTKVAGSDVGEHRLDAAVHGLEDELRVENGPEASTS
jgi:hypothetical protein